MPLLDWQAPRGAPVVSYRIWIYWVVTIPLTAAVLLLWSTWYIFSDDERGQPCLAYRKWLSEGLSRRKALAMHCLKASGLSCLWQRYKGNIGDDDTEVMTDDMV